MLQLKESRNYCQSGWIIHFLMLIIDGLISVLRLCGLHTSPLKELVKKWLHMLDELVNFELVTHIL